MSIVARFFIVISKEGILNTKMKERNFMLRNSYVIFIRVMKKKKCAKIGSSQFKKDLESIMRILYFMLWAMGRCC